MSDNKISVIPDTAITEIGNKIYDDVGHPVLGEVGASVQGILKFVSLPFKFLGMTADQLEKKYMNFIEKSLSKVPVEKRVQPEKYIIAPLMDNVKYYFDEGTIYDMYSELLSKAVNCDTRNQVHPLHLQILRQLSPVDADIFNDCFSSYDEGFVFLELNPREVFLAHCDDYKRGFKEIIKYEKYDFETISACFDVLKAINLFEDDDLAFYECDLGMSQLRASLSASGIAFRDVCIKK